ncbi:MAG: hypothetical protein JKY98_08130, partial [Gammaproteobacteria bacterium]|nr:hypothetical protein [Gammaproteobacteria bacterium]
MQIQTSNISKVLKIFIVLFFVTSISACSGTKILDEPNAIQPTRPLAISSDENIEIILEWVVVRDGPGTWARNSDWDEYLIRVKNQSGQRVELTNIEVVDSLGYRVQSDHNLDDLVKASRLTTKRYKNKNIDVKAGLGADAIMIAGGAVMVTGVAAGIA